MILEIKRMNASYKELKRLTKFEALGLSENISYDDYFRNLTSS